MQSYPFDLPSPVIRLEVMGPHMTKHHLADGKVIHHFTRTDTGHPHDHPWPFDSTILYGGYEEEEYVLHPNGTHTIVNHVRLPGQSHRVEANTAHRIIRLIDRDCWTIISPGKKVKEPGFFKFNNNRIYRRDWNGRWKLFFPAA